MRYHAIFLAYGEYVYQKRQMSFGTDMVVTRVKRLLPMASGFDFTVAQNNLVSCESVVQNSWTLESTTCDPNLRASAESDMARKFRIESATITHLDCCSTCKAYD